MEIFSILCGQTVPDIAKPGWLLFCPLRFPPFPPKSVPGGEADLPLLWEPVLTSAKSLQSHPALGNTMDCSLLGSSVHGILQARILEWVAVPSSRGSSNPGIES